MEKRGRGRFLVLDGIDGCGKSTQAEWLVRSLAEGARLAPLHLREPGSTAAGEAIRALLLDAELRLAPAAQVLLFAAARRQMLEEKVRPALEEGRDVVCERFHPATIAYQGFALGVGEERVGSLLREWASDPAPDLTIVLDLEPEEARGRRGQSDRFESRGEEFQRRVAEGFRRHAARAPGVVVLSARGSREEVHARIRAEVERAGR